MATAMAVLAATSIATVATRYFTTLAYAVCVCVCVRCLTLDRRTIDNATGTAKHTRTGTFFYANPTPCLHSSTYSLHGTAHSEFRFA